MPLSSTEKLLPASPKTIVDPTYSFIGDRYLTAHSADYIASQRLLGRPPAPWLGQCPLPGGELAERLSPCICVMT
jgi:hypothetical protein